MFRWRSDEVALVLRVFRRDSHAVGRPPKEENVLAQFSPLIGCAKRQGVVRPAFGNSRQSPEGSTIAVVSPAFSSGKGVCEEPGKDELELQAQRRFRYRD